MLATRSMRARLALDGKIAMTAALTTLLTRREPRSNWKAGLTWFVVTAFFPTAVCAAPAPEDPSVALARDAFTTGTELAKKADWAEALAAYERSAHLRPH